ncbi:phage major capsid protein [Lachnospiraceae bacterium CLA-AA-H215]|uniref:Phage major capsid protein n=1 Tax=Hominifimenecus microfluidus TaxID=2885348 RepID=A0AAE3EB32_9FIRM|nr:phage major capsid protein [Hominifimenecus microfluidus]MCC2231123.1 phage major capsid protein [Hominifimenecus microfluidus]
MKAKDLIEQAKMAFSKDFLAAIGNADEEGMAECLATFSESLQAALMEEAETGRNDAAVLASRGVRMLTSQETKYYQALASAMNANDPKMALTKIEVTMPETVIDAVMEDIASEFPLLDAIDFRNTTAITKWLYNAQGTQQATWDALGGNITKELSGAFQSLDMTQCKLTAYMSVGKDFLALGPAWLDRYVRAILAEANGLALESAVVDGDGAKKPIGMTRDLTNGSASGGVTTYQRKSATKVTTLDPASYGAILAKLTKSPSGRNRVVKEVILVVNPDDYLTKIMPATTILTPQGTYVSDVLPFPTKVIQSTGIPAGHAVVGIGSRYFAGMGTSKDGMIEYSDHAQFLEDARVYTTHLYGNGTPLDNNAFEYLDISSLQVPAANVKVQGTVTTKAEA